MKWTTPVTMTTVNAVRSVLFQLGIVVGSHRIANFSQIIILVYKTDI